MMDDINTIHPTITFKEELKPIQNLVIQCFNQDKTKMNVKIEPIKRKVEETKKERPKENKHPWDIAQEIITEQNLHWQLSGVLYLLKFYLMNNFDHTSCSRRTDRCLTFTKCSDPITKKYL